ncbi:hypothetical protein CEUSTIGMA_g3636.t1 [Chlamydomonas eustigma]|uniref:F-box domain-containing protein n=1 Tax=Chlamydomonas eustigma TaxID=1157962 RepID=A0A250WZY3_9CHLO|nr:hypothetical protein CEUSTIGMA_g3636.t1 [Chlamydomonas eustigma]|eukprot:GAX76192.1 hypothetical protein CEUSTIGMA_g3636.t1 [Chlamydomonas eustigma]
MRGIHALPDEMLLKILSFLPEFGPIWASEEIPLCRCLPYTCFDDDRNDDPLQGIRRVPFLQQVCKHWKSLLDSQRALELLNNHVVIDLGHELLNGIYYPLRFQSTQITDEEFYSRFDRSFLPASKIINYVRKRRHVLKALTINVEGFWSQYMDGDHEVGNHAEFDENILCFLLGMVSERLQELNMYNRYCRLQLNSGLESGIWSSISSCTSLTKLSINGQGPGSLSNVQEIPKRCLVAISQLKNLTYLNLTSFDPGPAVMDIPEAWSSLSCLTDLELSMPFNRLVLPGWCHILPLRRLHLSTLYIPSGVAGGAFPEFFEHSRGDLHVTSKLTNLEVLSLQGYRISERLGIDLLPVGGGPRLYLSRLYLPSLSALAPQLKVVSLTGCGFTRLPLHIFQLKNLEILDLSGNTSVWILGPMAPFLDLFPCLRLLDLRGVAPWRNGVRTPGGANFPYAAEELQQLIGLKDPRLLQLLLGPVDPRGSSLLENHVTCNEREGAGAGWQKGRQEDDLLLSQTYSFDKVLESEKESKTSADSFNSYCASPSSQEWHSNTHSPKEQMIEHMTEGKRYLESRPPWRPGVRGSLSIQHNIEDLPDWRCPSAGDRHGPGPWMLMDAYGLS